MTVRTLTEVFEIPHPGSIIYKAFDKKQRTILVPTLGLKREEPERPPEKPLCRVWNARRPGRWQA